MQGKFAAGCFVCIISPLKMSAKNKRSGQTSRENRYFASAETGAKWFQILPPS
jgi:hypothetical protein